jgi:hypothetical protein
MNDMYKWIKEIVDQSVARTYSGLAMFIDYAFAKDDTIEPKPVGTNIGEALEWLKAGDKVSRTAWQKYGDLYIYAVGKKNVAFYGVTINMVTADQHIIPWVPTQGDVVADDWVKVIGNDTIGEI